MARDLIGPILTALLDCAYGQLDPKPERKIVAPGEEVAWDNCCGGQVWVRLISMEAPDESNVPSQCGPPFWLVTVGLGVIRCAHVVKDNGKPPTPTEVSSDGLAMTRDLSALRDAVQCCAPSIKNVSRVGLDRWDPLGPTGGCHGGEWTLTFVLMNCNCDHVTLEAE